MSMPKGKHIFGTVKVGERGQIVIPKEAREIFDINPGDTLLVLGDEEQGIAVVKADVMKEVAVKILKGLGRFGREKEMMNNSFFSILPFLLAADLMLPFLLAPTYKGYSHLRQVMSVLGASKAPLHSIYNFWLIIFGCAILVSHLSMLSHNRQNIKHHIYNTLFRYLYLRNRRLHTFRVFFSR